MPITLTSSDPTPDLGSIQTHLGAIRYPCLRKNIQGLGVAVRVVDGGWRLDHEALRGRGLPKPNQQGVREMDINHGTAVLGILAGRDPLRGMIPNANFELRLWFTLQTELQLASEQLRHGDVLLIERCLGAPPDELPVETSPDLRPWLIECVARGVVVVEPAGNLGRHFVLPDSGAIMVAGAYEQEGVIHPTGSTSYGDRIDVCAPALRGITCGPSDYIDGPDPNRHYGMFDGTSMASAIVAGVCAGINSARLAAGKAMLGGQEMRNLLVSTGRDTAGEIRIGKFLDMTRALQTTLPDPDFDMDGVVGWEDFFAFAACWPDDLRGDFDGDGRVGWGDFDILRRRLT